MRGGILSVVPGVAMSALGLVMVGCVSLPAATPAPVIPAPAMPQVSCIKYTPDQIKAWAKAMDAMHAAKPAGYQAIDGFMADYHNMRAAAGCDQ